MYQRESALADWLHSVIQHKNFRLQPLAGDASFRRYFRVHYDGLSQVVMDAPPPKENIKTFIQVAHCLQKADIATPKLLAQDEQQGFLLLSDLGDTLLLHALKQETVDSYYHSAIQTLLHMQAITPEASLPLFNEAFMLQEMALCLEWFLEAYLQLPLNATQLQLLQDSMQRIALEIAEQPQVFIHRDFHSRNLMVLPNQSLAVIDFQDAMMGPITYDLVSLLKDCYIPWPRHQVIQWLHSFHQSNPRLAHYSAEGLLRAFDLCGLQRHLKVLGIFARLHLRDNKPGYLADLPRVLDYVLACTALYPDLSDLHELMRKVQLP